MPLIKIYCAGGDVFLPQKDQQDHFQGMRDKAKNLSNDELTLKLLIPIDNDIGLENAEDIFSARRNALAIRIANENMIKECDAIIANLSPFRGNEPDCGTAYECGYARALEKVVVTYTDNNLYQIEKYKNFDFSQKSSDQRFSYTQIEDFSLPFNLMLYEEKMPIFSHYGEALEFIADLFHIVKF